MRLTGKPIAGRFHYHSVIGAVLHLLKQVVFLHAISYFHHRLLFGLEPRTQD
jgi:hypothetical protein